MKASIISATLLAALTSAAPSRNTLAARENDPAYAVAKLAAIDNSAHTVNEIYITFGQLYSNSTLQVTSLRIDSAETDVPNETVDVSKVECRRFKDQYALQPGSIAFKGQGGTADISTNPVEFGYVLCYVTE